MRRRPTRATPHHRDRPAAPTGRGTTSPGPDWLALHAAAAPGAAGGRWSSILAFSVISALAVALLATILGPHRIGDYYTETDFYGSYAAGARLIQQGRLIPSRYGVVGPGFEVMLGLAGFLVRDLFLAAELLAGLGTAAMVLLWFLLLRRLADARLGLLATLFLATNAVLFRYGYSATTDAPALALQAAALWLLVARPGPRGAAAAGLVAALAVLTRYSAIYLLPAGLFVIGARTAGTARRGRDALLFAAGFALPIAPWVIYSLAQGGGFRFQLHHDVAYEVFARPRGIPWDEYQRRMHPQFHNLWDVIARDPGAVMRRMAFNGLDHLRLDGRDLLGWPVAACAALGAVLAAVDGGHRRLWPVGLAGALAFLSLLPTFHSVRYSLTVLPVYASAAAWLFASPRFALSLRPARGLRLKSVLALVPLALALRSSVMTQARVLGELPVEVLPMARTLRALAAPGDRVIARKPHLPYLSGVAGLAFPFADSLEDLARFARGQRARWLYVSWPEVQTRPRLSYLLDTAAVVPGLTPRAVSRPHASVLYEIGPRFGERPAWMANDTLVTWHLARSQLLVDPDHPEALFAVAMVEASHRRFDEARRQLERSARLAPTSVAPWLLLGEIALRQDDPARAADSYRRALDLDPRNVTAQAGLGWASLLEGRLDETAARWGPLLGPGRDPASICRMLFHTTSDPQDSARARAAFARSR
jgi:tetratricopeptide (TPR) repeat protein